MKSIYCIFLRKFLAIFILSEIVLGYNVSFAATVVESADRTDSLGYVLYKGVVVDHKSDKPLAFASIVLKGTNISVISNSEGAFSLKVPNSQVEGSILVSYMGYKNKILSVSGLQAESNRIELDALDVLLPEISVIFSDAASLMRAVMEKKGDNYSENSSQMTAFYREKIKKRKTYVSLLEAVVDIYKYPYTSVKMDRASLYKVRKNTDYQKLDTLIFKLMGGPYNTLYADVMKNTEMFFTDDMMSNYVFSFDKSTRIGDRLIYVLDFKQKLTYVDPLYYGKLYIDAQSLALVSAVFGLNLENRDAASQIFVRKKPLNAKAYPTKSSCRIYYVQKDGKWYLSYCRVELDIYIDWKRKLFNTLYESTMEMAVTDWTAGIDEQWTKSKVWLKPSAIVIDKVSGFADTAFWGEYNVIEPEKPIESAIRKIQKQLRKR